MMRSAACVAGISAAVAVLAHGSVAEARQRTPKAGELMVYYCQNLSVLTVRVLPKGVEVTTDTRTSTLAETSQPSGARYSDGSVTLSSLEDNVRVEEPGAVYWCRSTPAEVPWEEARRRGIDFRAVGDQPAWSLEVDSDVKVEFATGSGAERRILTFPPVSIAGTDDRIAWTTRSGSRALAVVAERRVCQHAGSTMTLAVTVTVDGKTYRGCGRTFAPRR